MLHHHVGTKRTNSDHEQMEQETTAAESASAAMDLASLPRPARVRERSASIATSVISMDDQVTTEDLASGVTAIRLTADEQHLFDTLVQVAEAYEKGQLQLEGDEPAFQQQQQQQYNNKDPQQQPLEIRVAGGWVRDKILNLHSHDVDIALNCMSGVHFATLVKAYLQQTHQDPESARRKIGVIGANPSQSKHLETATMKIYGVDVDFVNLRAQEVYEDHSRIPTQQTRQFGTPLDDALRRDFTINSLFFNLRDKSLEDWTGRGLRDLLHHKKIVTPLDPHTTFHDDPLRVLRAIRFGVRYNFNLDDNLKRAAMSPPVHESLHRKVSRERVGKELEGMLMGKGANPAKALDLITELKLAGSVFLVPTEEDTSAIEGTVLGHAYKGDHNELSHCRELGWEEARALLNLLPSVLEANEDWVDAKESAVDIRLLHLAVFLWPFTNLSYMDDKKNKLQLVVAHMIKEGVKFKNKDVQSMVLLMEHADKMKSFFTEEPTRLELGLLLRSLKDLWVTCLLLATVVALRQAETSGHNSDMEPLLQSSHVLYTSIIDMRLDGCWKVRPLMDGLAIISALDLPKGPMVGTYVDEQVRWMLLNPDGTREDCERHLRERKREFEGVSNERSVGLSDGASPTLRASSGKPMSKKFHIEPMEPI